LLALKHVNDINISASPHRTLNSSRGIIRYRDDDLSELTDAEICKELEPQGIITVKRFISRKTGQEVKLNTVLITFYIFLFLEDVLVLVSIQQRGLHGAMYNNSPSLSPPTTECQYRQ
jgi:hypothetical protein